MNDLICDTSVIQYLDSVGRLDLLRHLGGRVLVPQAVALELRAGREGGLRLPDPHSIPWMHVVDHLAEAIIGLPASLGDGEIAVISLAHRLRESGATAALDDRAARQAAERLSIRFWGTLGILLEAKRRGLVKGVSPILNQLQQAGFRVSPAIIEEIARQADETE